MIIASVAVLLVPVWGGFDLLLEPQRARGFIVVRLVCDLPILGLLWLLWRRSAGRRRPELLSFAVIAIVQSEIAWMVVRATHDRDVYLLGFSLPLYASGCVMGGRPRWTGAVVGSSWLALGIALLTAPDPLPSRDLIAAGFYLSTASIIALVAHLQRFRLTDRELKARERLEIEQRHTRQLLSQLQRLSNEDSLTEVANRRRWDTELQEACDRARAGGPALAVLLIDVDRFKDVNDRHGHAGGDETLRLVASFLTREVGERGLVARLGGDEFGVLLRETEAGGAVAIGEALLRQAHQLRPCGDTLSLSVGVAAATGKEAEPDRLVRRADAQLYRAKATRNAVAA